MKNKFIFSLYQTKILKFKINLCFIESEMNPKKFMLITKIINKNILNLLKTKNNFTLFLLMNYPNKKKY